MTEFFKQLVGLAGYGLVGVAFIMVIVLAYVMVKMPNNKFAIGVLAIFCFLVLILFTYAGVGVTKENKQLSQTLTDTTAHLSDSIKIANAKMNIASLQNILLTKPKIGKDSLAEITSNFAKNLDTLYAKDKSPGKNTWRDLSNQYKIILSRLNNNEYDSARGKSEIIKNFEKVSPAVLERMK